MPFFRNICHTVSSPLSHTGGVRCRGVVSWLSLVFNFLVNTLNTCQFVFFVSSEFATKPEVRPCSSNHKRHVSNQQNQEYGWQYQYPLNQFCFTAELYVTHFTPASKILLMFPVPVVVFVINKAVSLIYHLKCIQLNSSTNALSLSSIHPVKLIQCSGIKV